ncbi:coiled-coil domain-containing protein 81-like [Aquila chrysaetos chrysaetos]|uniref:coiled-coil domain-containing protein 81-like n=1 Tax=Aquila chrysaetos chrysaetos TaxID=223781 RepID=UPI0011766633|nr:coiled-coil domain-containing protein 81-like [Aquila chrysaetos chrysaetos]
MSSYMAVAPKEQPTSVRRTKMDFWDGMEHAFMMPSATAKANAEQDLIFLCFPEQTSVWDAVAGYVQEQLLLHKRVRIPTLGSFDVVPTRTQVGNEIVIIQRPVFRLARNLATVHNLMDDKDNLPGSKVLEPMKYAKVAMDASVSRRKVEGCILGVTSLLSQCLGKGENVALVLRDVGVLLIEGRSVQMRFYFDFLERMSGKRNLEKAAFKVPQLLKMVVSRVASIASLTLSGRVIIFPEFELELVTKPTPRDPLKALRNVPAEDKGKKKEGLPPLGQDTEGKAAPARFPEPPLPANSSLTNNECEQLWDKAVMEMRNNLRVRRLPEIPGASFAKKQRKTGQPKGKPAPKGRASELGRAQAAKPPRCRGKGKGEKKDALEGGELKMAKGKTFRSCGVQTLPPPPRIAILSPSSPETSPLEVPLYDTSFLMPPVDEASMRCYYQKRRSRLPRME